MCTSGGLLSRELLGAPQTEKKELLKEAVAAAAAATVLGSVLRTSGTRLRSRGRRTPRRLWRATSSDTKASERRSLLLLLLLGALSTSAGCLGDVWFVLFSSALAENAGVGERSVHACLRVFRLVAAAAFWM